MCARDTRPRPRPWWPGVLGFLLLLPGLARAAESPADVRLAYLDPGTGSFIIQALVAVVAGLMVAARLYWNKIKSLFGRSTPATEDDAPPDDE